MQSRAHDIGGLTVYGRQIRITRGLRQAVSIAHRFAANDLNREAKITHHAANDLQLLIILLAEHRHIGLDVDEEPGNDRGDSIEEVRPELPIKQITGDAIMTAENKKWASEDLGVPVRDVESMASRLSASDRSLNAPLATDGDAQWQDLLPDESATPDQVVMEERDNAKRKEWIAQALEVLNERETLIISERRLTDDSVTLEVLGKRLGISKERVRQIEHQALNKLRKTLTKIVGDPEKAGLIPAT